MCEVHWITLPPSRLPREHALVETATTPSDSAPRRPWRRLHLSTLLALLPLSMLLAALGVPARWLVPPEANRVVCQRGWPVAFSTFELDPASSLDGFGDAPWLTAANWSVLSFETIELFPLIVDVTVALLVLGVAASVLEWRRRRRQRVWHTTLREILGVTFLLSIALAWVAMAKQHRDRELAALRRLKPFFRVLYVPSGDASFVPEAVDYSPVWLSQLVPGRLRTWFERYDFLEFGPTEEEVQGQMQLDDLLAFERLRYLYVEGPLLREQDLVRILEDTELAVISLADCSMQHSTLRRIAACPSIENVSFSNVPLSKSDLRTLAGEGSRIQYLAITGVPVSDEFIERVIRSPRFLDLELYDCSGISRDIDSRIRQWRPNCLVEWDGKGTLTYQPTE